MTPSLVHERNHVAYIGFVAITVVSLHQLCVINILYMHVYK